jgi:integrase
LADHQINLRRDVVLTPITRAVQRLHLLTDLFGGELRHCRLRQQAAQNVNALIRRIGRGLGAFCRLVELLAKFCILCVSLLACLALFRGGSLGSLALVFAAERTGEPLIPALAQTPKAQHAIPAATATLDQITGHATPFLAHFKLWQEVTPRTGDTLKMYVRDIKEFARIVAEPLETLGQHHVCAWAERLAADNTPETIRRKLTSLKAYWQWLIRKKLVDASRHPFTGLQIDDPRSSAERQEGKRIRWPVKIVPTLWQAAEQEGRIVLAKLIRLGAYTGGRIESLATLMTSSILSDPDTGIRFLHFADKTEAGVRDVPVHSAIMPLIDDLITNAGPDGYLFKVNHEANRKANATGVEFSRFKRHHGYDDPRLVFHSLRKTIAHLLETAECPENVAQDICGHIKRGMTFGLYSGVTRLDQRQHWLEKAVRYPV